MKELYPQHYAMTLLGFVIGARPSTLRPLRRSGPTPDVLWDERLVLLRRSHTMGTEIMDRTKTKRDLEIPLPAPVMEALREHVAQLDGAMATSDYLFPSLTGGLRASTVLGKPFAEVVSALGWKMRFTPLGMRRTFNDLARGASVPDLVTRAISGYATEEMQHHYSTAQREEVRGAVESIMASLTGAANDTALEKKDEEK